MGVRFRLQLFLLFLLVYPLKTLVRILLCAFWVQPEELPWCRGLDGASKSLCDLTPLMWWTLEAVVFSFTVSTHLPSSARILLVWNATLLMSSFVTVCPYSVSIDQMSILGLPPVLFLVVSDRGCHEEGINSAGNDSEQTGLLEETGWYSGQTHPASRSEARDLPTLQIPSILS